MRAVTLAVIVLIFILLWKSGALHLLSMTELKARQHELEAAVRENPVLSALVFLIGYILVTGLSVPGATVLTLGGGAIFGFFRGVLLVSFASTLGATLAFVLARFLFGDLVRRRFADRLKAVNQGFEREGAYYLFSLRLIPVFPFFIVNILMSLTPIRAGTFYWVSQLGMLPATLLYVNAGTRLASIETPREIASPAVLISFAALGVLPLLTKRILRAVHA